jgi:hypothetical protein
MDDRDGRPLHERVAALERTVTDGHVDEGLPDAARMDARLDDVEATVEDVDDRVAELDAAVQALRGFAGGVRAVDEAVERRADAAVARVDRLESELEEIRETVSSRNSVGDGEPYAGPTDPEPSPSPRHGTHADSRGDPHRAEVGTEDNPDPSPPGDGASDPGRDGDDGRRDRIRGGSLNRDVAARTDAALAEAAATAATADDPEGADDAGSLADRLRRLL